MTQMTLFGDAETLKKVRKVHVNSSGNPIVFRDYASFVAKFTEQPKTTDDCYTPEDVYNAVVEYVGTITDMTGKCILRPFYPGGDYENAEYPDNGIVIDNPPFSMFTKIVRWYLANDVPFFLFGNGMTIMQICKYGATAVITGGVSSSTTVPRLGSISPPTCCHPLWLSQLQRSPMPSKPARAKTKRPTFPIMDIQRTSYRCRTCRPSQPVASTSQ